jgi:hypothetical protein
VARLDRLRDHRRLLRLVDRGQAVQVTDWQEVKARFANYGPDGTGRLVKSYLLEAIAEIESLRAKPICDAKDCERPATGLLNTNYGVLGNVCDRHYAELKAILG